MAWLLYIFTNRFGINTYPDTIRPHPDTPRHNSDTPRHRHCYAIWGTERKCNIWVSCPNIFFANRFSIDASQDTLRHHLDIIQTLSDTIQTSPEIDVFMHYRGYWKKRAISKYYELIEILPIDLVLVHPETSSFHISDTIQTPPDTTRTHPVISVLCNTRHWKKRQYLSFLTFYKFL